MVELAQRAAHALGEGRWTDEGLEGFGGLAVTAAVLVREPGTARRLLSVLHPFYPSIPDPRGRNREMDKLDRALWHLVRQEGLDFEDLVPFVDGVVSVARWAGHSRGVLNGDGWILRVVADLTTFKKMSGDRFAGVLESCAVAMVGEPRSLQLAYNTSCCLSALARMSDYPLAAYPPQMIRYILWSWLTVMEATKEAPHPRLTRAYASEVFAGIVPRSPDGKRINIPEELIPSPLEKPSDEVLDKLTRHLLEWRCSVAKLGAEQAPMSTKDEESGPRMLLPSLSESQRIASGPLASVTRETIQGALLVLSLAGRAKEATALLEFVLETRAAGEAAFHQARSPPRPLPEGWDPDPEAMAPPAWDMSLGALFGAVGLADKPRDAFGGKVEEVELAKLVLKDLDGPEDSNFRFRDWVLARRVWEAGFVSANEIDILRSCLWNMIGLSNLEGEASTARPHNEILRRVIAAGVWEILEARRNKDHQVPLSANSLTALRDSFVR
ncbi:MAG: hypothetical protein JRN50_03010 [Nitrososphaerota archaeon]|nr:hypothetical protein [Nitrososphaerota archaeon]